MRTLFLAALAALTVVTGAQAESIDSGATPTAAPPKIGAMAPPIEAKDTKGQAIKLSDYLGKLVVLEWTNNGCPFVQKHYGANNMQALQKKYTDQGVVWISIVSSAPGKEGHVTPAEADKITADAGATITAKILDESGAIGHAYDAKTTPHMFVIDREGKIAYMGAIDNEPSPDPASIQGANNYVAAALDALIAGRPVETPETKPYGCGVKY